MANVDAEWTEKERQESRLEILACLRSLQEACGFDEFAPRYTFLKWLLLAVQKTRALHVPGDSDDFDRRALSDLAHELSRMREESNFPIRKRPLT
jgi:hypothetical protein